MIAQYGVVLLSYIMAMPSPNTMSVHIDNSQSHNIMYDTSFIDRLILNLSLTPIIVYNITYLLMLEVLGIIIAICI